MCRRRRRDGRGADVPLYDDAGRRFPHRPLARLSASDRRLACSGHGFKFAPVIGEILADLAVDGHHRARHHTLRIRSRLGSMARRRECLAVTVHHVRRCSGDQIDDLVDLFARHRIDIEVALLRIRQELAVCASAANAARSILRDPPGVRVAQCTGRAADFWVIMSFKNLAVDSVLAKSSAFGTSGRSGRFFRPLCSRMLICFSRIQFGFCFLRRSTTTSRRCLALRRARSPARYRRCRYSRE